MNLTTDTDLAAKFGITVEKLHELRKRHNWPHVRLGRFTFRFTDLQIEQIVASQTVTPAADTSSSGLSRRSASRRRAS
jgi:hypothetical protein